MDHPIPDFASMSWEQLGEYRARLWTRMEIELLAAEWVGHAREVAIRDLVSELGRQPRKEVVDAAAREWLEGQFVEARDEMYDWMRAAARGGVLRRGSFYLDARATSEVGCAEPEGVWFPFDTTLREEELREVETLALEVLALKPGGHGPRYSLP